MQKKYRFSGIVYEEFTDGSYTIGDVPKEKIVKYYNFSIDRFMELDEKKIGKVANDYVYGLKDSLKRKGLI